MTACDRQLRLGATGLPFALDFGAVMAVGIARRVDQALLADVLPDVEAVILAAMNDDGSAGGDDNDLGSGEDG